MNESKELDKKRKIHVLMRIDKSDDNNTKKDEKPGTE